MEARTGSGGAPRASLAGFVSTSLFGDNVEETRVTEAPAPRAEDAAGYKPLYEQLQELREKKDSDWKEKNNPFGGFWSVYLPPPKALDDEDIEFIRDLETKKEDLERRRHTQHEEDLAQFLLARGTPKTAAGAALTTQHLQKYPAKNDVKAANKKVAVVVRAKRKAGSGNGNGKANKTQSKPAATSNTQQQHKKKQKVEEVAAASSSAVEKPKANAAAALGLGLVGYGSDSDSDTAASK
ncbi:hypothetical protein BBJ28_00006673 [Nothophytophthora sp. Chile5]|nr:hypothetical protein BBJ28_00006673 [Nothophytophthora sp. Chile5]